MLELGGPSDRSAIVVRARLPDRLERLRRASVANAADGVPAHLTLLHPFVAPERLGNAVRARIAAVAARHQPFAYRLANRARFPDALYVAVEPLAPFVALQADLAAAFPAFPIYGADATFQFIPHVTVAAGTAVGRLGIEVDPGWRSLPADAHARWITVIARDPDGRWRTRWRIRLG